MAAVAVERSGELVRTGPVLRRNLTKSAAKAEAAGKWCTAHTLRFRAELLDHYGHARLGKAGEIDEKTRSLVRKIRCISFFCLPCFIASKQCPRLPWNKCWECCSSKSEAVEILVSPGASSGDRGTGGPSPTPPLPMTMD